MKLNDLIAKIEGHQKELSRISVMSKKIGTSTEDFDKLIAGSIDGLSKMIDGLYDAIGYDYKIAKYDVKTPIYRNPILLKEGYDVETQDSLLVGALASVSKELTKFTDEDHFREYQRIIQPEILKFVELKKKYFSGHKAVSDNVGKLLALKIPEKKAAKKTVNKTKKVPSKAKTTKTPAKKATVKAKAKVKTKGKAKPKKVEKKVVEKNTSPEEK